jgi:hypothetical protein
VPLFAFMAVVGLMVAMSAHPRSPAVAGAGGPQGLPPPRLPPVLRNGTLGHTGLPAPLFVGVPPNLIWAVDQAYQAGSPRVMETLVDYVRPYSPRLAQALRVSARARTRGMLLEKDMRRWA